VRVALWSPLPPAPSGIADHVAESLPHLAPRCDLTVVAEDPATVDPGVARLVRVVAPDAVPPVDVDVYEIGNSPAHGYVYRTALARPGVAVLHEWGLHDLVLHETAGRGDPAAYVREMRRGHGEAGTFVARQVLRGLGGDTLPARFSANDRLLESSLAIVATTRFTAQQAARRLPGRPVIHLPLLVVAPSPASADRAAARRALGLPTDALVVTAPGLATRSKRLDVAIRAVARVLRERPSVRLVVAGPREEALPLEQWGAAAGLGDALVLTGRLPMADFERHLAAADVVLALRFPTRGEMSAALLRALAAGRPTLVTAGTPAAQEFPEGVVIPVDPGAGEEAELAGWIRALADRPALGAAIGRSAAAFVRERHDAPALAAGLVRFLAEVAPGRAAFAQRLAAQRAHDGTRLGEFLAEVRSAARELGIADLVPDPEGIAGLLAPLAGGGRP
jgi:glycosyltransferase involved in cell wall biosynthesis